MAGNCTTYGGKSGTRNAENPGYNPRMEFKPYAEMMGAVLETGLEYYTAAMTMVMPEVAAVARVPGFIGLTGIEIAAINRSVGGVTALTGSVDTVIANAANYGTNLEKIAVHIRDIAGRHLFNDGNKRTAQIVTEKLSAKNGMPMDLSKIRAVIDRVARGDIRSVEEIVHGLGGK